MSRSFNAVVLATALAVVTQPSLADQKEVVTQQITIPYADLPETPADISLFFENGKYVFRLETQSIYVYDRDKGGLPSCTGQCALLWLPVIASGSANPVGEWTLVERADRSRQWRYRNRPVYTYAHDKAGQTSGAEVDGLWHLVQPPLPFRADVATGQR